MKIKNIKLANFYEENNQKKKNNISIIKMNKSFYQKQNHSSLIMKSSKIKKFHNFAFNEKISKSKFRLTKVVEFVKKLKDKKNININLNNYKVDVRHFYRIRKQIYYNFKKPYISPYINDFLINKKYNNLGTKIDMDESSSKELPKYYDYFQISYLLNKNIKNYRLLSRYIDFLMFADEQEYIMKYFIRMEINNILNYLLFHIYAKDK